MIPEAAVEAAAKWLHDNDCRSAVHSGFPADSECYDWLDEAKDLLEAALPHVLAEQSARLAYQAARAEYFRYAPEIEHDPEGVKLLADEMNRHKPTSDDERKR